MQEEATVAITFLALAVLAPLVPAFLLFKFLPSTGSVSGPWKGLNLKFGGAFSAYLVIFFSLLAVRPGDFNHYHEWTVTGLVRLQQPPGDDAPDPRDVVVRLVPPDLDLDNNWQFRFRIPVPEDSNGNLDFPRLQFDLNGYQGVTVDLDENASYGSLVQAKRDPNRERTIRFGEIVLQSNSPNPYVEQTAQKPVPVNK